MASVVVTMSGDEAKLWKSFQKIVDQQRKAEEGYKNISTKSRQAAGEMESGQRRAQAGFDKTGKSIREQGGLIGEATKGIKAYATAAGAVGAAVAAIRAAWKQVIEEQQKGLDALKKNEDTGRALLQISDSPEQFQQMRQQSQQLSSQFGVDITTVERVMFSAVSEGFRDAVPEIIAANQVIAPEAAAGVAGQVPALFKNQIGALEAVNLTLKAARDSRLNFEDIARSLPGAAEGGAVAGASPEETLAVLSVLASRFKSGDTAADRIKAFSTKVGIDQGTSPEDLQKEMEAEQQRVANAQKQLRTKEERVADLERQLATKATSKTRADIETRLQRARRDVAEFDRSSLEFRAPQQREGLGGKGILSAVEAIQGMSEADRKDFLKDSQELNVAFQVLSEEMTTIKQRIAEIKQERQAFASGGGILQNRIATAEGDATLSALRKNNQATQRLEEAYRTGKGIEGATAATATAIAERQLLNQGSVISRTLNRYSGGIAARAGTLTGLDADTAGSVGATAINEAAGAPGKLLQAIELLGRAAASQSRAAEKLDRAAGRQISSEAARVKAALAAQGS